MDIDELCPRCGRPWVQTETILPDGELGCECRLDEMDQVTCPACGAMFDTILADVVECPCCCATFHPVFA